MKSIRVATLRAAILILVSGAAASAADAPSTQPTTQSADTASILSQVDAAYSRLQSAEFDGQITGRFDVAGQQKNQDLAFTSAFKSPNLFRHDAKDDVLIVGSGEKVFGYEVDRNAYFSEAAPKDRAAMSEWPAAVVGILQQQNPSLLLALSKSASAELNELSPQISRQPDTRLGDALCPTIAFDLADHTQVTLLFDPASSLLREARYDLRKMMEEQGATDVKQAEVDIRYTSSSTASPLDAAKFAFAPPDGAMLVSASSPAAAVSAGDPGEAATSMEGKPAPDFTLSSVDGTSVRMSSLKGSVVIVDLWATWCGPCVASLPNLDRLYKEQSPRGLKVYAVNLQEEADTVKPFLLSKKLSLPVLLDTDGKVGKLYQANAIPETVVVGKDGIVKKVFVGMSDESEEALKALVVKELVR